MSCGPHANNDVFRLRLLAAVYIGLMISGCDKLPKMGELGDKKSSEPDASTTDAPVDVAAEPSETPDPALTEPGNQYAGISVAEFLKLKAYDNDSLKAVATSSNDLTELTVLRLGGGEGEARAGGPDVGGAHGGEVELGCRHWFGHSSEFAQHLLGVGRTLGTEACELVAGCMRG